MATVSSPDLSCYSIWRCSVHCCLANLPGCLFAQQLRAVSICSGCLMPGVVNHCLTRVDDVVDVEFFCKLHVNEQFGEYTLANRRSLNTSTHIYAEQILGGSSEVQPGHHDVQPKPLPNFL